MKAIPTARWMSMLLCVLAQPAMARESRLSQRHPSAKTASAAPAESAELPESASTIQADLDEERRYREVKARAENDPEMRKLKLKSDSALTETQARESLIAYNRALFRKISQLDPALKERAESVQNAILRMIGG